MSDRMDRRGFLALGVGALAVAAAPPLLRPRERLFRRSVPVMGTVAELAVPGRQEGWAQHAMGEALDELRRIEALMTRFRDDSDVGRFNALSGEGTVPVSPETAEVVRSALAWAAVTGGVFDPCLGRITAGGDGRGRRAATLAGRRLWRAVAVEGDPGAPRLRKLDPDAQLDLGGIAKGYGVDRAVAVLRGWGVERGLVNAGGDLMALGEGLDGGPWRVGVREPGAGGGLRRTLELVDEAVATSGDYLEPGHLLDPATGRPVRAGLRTITVAAPDVMSADAAATAAFGLGAEGATRTLDAHRPGLRVVDAA